MSEDYVRRLANQRVTEWMLMQQAQKEAEKHAHEPKVDPQRTVITISRQYGAGGHSVALELVEALGESWQIWDKEIVDEISKRAKVVADFVSMFDERALSTHEQIVNLLLQNGMRPDQYNRHLTDILFALGYQGKKVIIGRGANFVLRKSLSIRLQASLDFRIAVICKRDGLNADEARKKIASVDRDRAHFIFEHFHQEIEAPANYDIIFQVDRLGIKPTVAAIVSAMHSIVETKTIS